MPDKMRMSRFERSTLNAQRSTFNSESVREEPSKLAGCRFDAVCQRQRRAVNRSPGRKRSRKLTHKKTAALKREVIPIAGQEDLYLGRNGE
jgi:hypothetical protein